MWFKIYEECNEPKEILMRNHDTAKVLGIGIVDLKFIFGKELTLANIFQVP